MTPRPLRSTALLTAAIVALTIGAAVLLLRPGGTQAPADPPGPPTALSSSAASLAEGQSTARRFADVFAGYLNGTRDPGDLAAAGATIDVVQSITATPDRREPDDPRSHYVAQDVDAEPQGKTLQLTATFIDGDLRIPLVATMSRVGTAWRVTNFFTSQD